MPDIRIDLCRIDKHTGCVEACYPTAEWETVDSLGNCYGVPPEDFQARVVSAGVAVLAYGSDGTWFALKRRNDPASA